MSALLNAIDQNYQKKIEEATLSYNQLLEELYTKRHQKAYEEYERTLKLKKKDIDLEGRRLQEKYLRQIKHEINELKETLVNTIYLEIVESLQELSFEDIQPLIEVELSKNQLKPRIEVCETLYTKTKEMYGSSFQVISSSTIQSGFKLIYEHYDLNYDMQDRLKYQEETIKKRIYQELFGKGKDYEF